MERIMPAPVTCSEKRRLLPDKTQKTMEANLLKQTIIQAVDAAKNDLLTLSHNIHANPELGFEETKAAAWQTALLAKYGFKVETPYGGLATSYRATFKGKSPGPRIAILAEYDALAGVGHACGHNIIASSAVGAGIGLASIMRELAGEVVVIGTPAEEGGSGKVILVEKGAFADVNYAMMMHPSTQNVIGRGGLAAVTLKVEYIGKATHSSGPEKGINALTSLIGLFNNINALRGMWKLKEGSNVNGIITAGGVASNIIPEFAAAKFTARAYTRRYLLKMIEDIKVAAQSAALLTGAEYKMEVGLISAERYPNLAMGETFKANMETLGEAMNYPDPQESLGSSDVGNVSIIVPTIHDYLYIASKDVNSHSVEFREAAASKRGDDVVLLAAKGLAMTAYDIFTDGALRERIAAEFAKVAAASA
jgi:amidohydrolase